MELKQLSDGPIGLGARVRRRNVRWGTPVDGEIEVVEWEPKRALAMHTRDANMEMHGRTTFEPDGPDRTVVRVVADISGLDEARAQHLSTLIQRSIATVKEVLLPRAGGGAQGPQLPRVLHPQPVLLPGRADRGHVVKDRSVGASRTSGLSARERGPGSSQLISRWENHSAM
jgi:hypothetical protein